MYKKQVYTWTADIHVHVRINKHKIHVHGHSLLCLCRSASSTKYIKFDIEPLINIIMNLIVLFTDLFRSESFFKSLSLCSCPIFISSTNIQYIVITQPTISVKQILITLYMYTVQWNPSNTDTIGNSKTCPFNRGVPYIRGSTVHVYCFTCTWIHT